MRDVSKGSPKRIRFFLSATPDLDPDRLLLREVALPRLRALGAQHDVVVDLVDLLSDQPDLSSDDLLPTSLDEIDQCRPYFVGLLGNQYGSAPRSILPSLLAKHPWLSAQHHRSVPELEMLHGALNDPVRATSALFYIRGPSPDQSGTNSDARADPAAIPAEAQRLTSLKERVRSSGLPVREGYATSEELVDLVIRDLAVHVIRAAATGSSEAAWAQPVPAGAALADEKPLHLDENVQFTVYRPRSIQPRKWHSLLAFAHLSERSADAELDEPDPVEEVRRQAAQILGEVAADYQDVTQDSSQAVPRDGELTFAPEVPGVEFNPPRRSFLWQESVHREEFRLRAGESLAGQTLRGRLTVFLGSIVLADVALTLRVDTGVTASTRRTPSEVSQARPYRRIFASYSRRDVAIVQEVERYAQATGDHYLRDLVDLRSGEVWSDRLPELIEQADIFQLFWSERAMRSSFVRQEWEHAASLARPNFIRPVYWQEPFPKSLEEGLPPEALGRLHFSRIFPTTSQSPTLPIEPPVESAPWAQPQTTSSASSTVGAAQAPVPVPAAPGPTSRGGRARVILAAGAPMKVFIGVLVVGLLAVVRLQFNAGSTQSASTGAVAIPAGPAATQLFVAAPSPSAQTTCSISAPVPSPGISPGFGYYQVFTLNANDAALLNVAFDMGYPPTQAALYLYSPVPQGFPDKSGGVALPSGPPPDPVAAGGESIDYSAPPGNRGFMALVNNTGRVNLTGKFMIQAPGNAVAACT